MVLDSLSQQFVQAVSPKMSHSYEEEIKLTVEIDSLNRKVVDFKGLTSPTFCLIQKAKMDHNHKADFSGNKSLLLWFL